MLDRSEFNQLQEAPEKNGKKFTAVSIRSRKFAIQGWPEQNSCRYPGSATNKIGLTQMQCNRSMGFSVAG
jgi:hypothetical protein